MAEVTKNVREFLPRKDAYKDSKTSKRGGIEKNGRFFPHGAEVPQQRGPV